MQSAFENRVWLTWLVKVRILILTLLLGIELGIAQFTPVAFPFRLFADAIVLAYTISAFYIVLLHFWDELKPQAVLQLISDLLLVSLFVYITGGVDSDLNFLYPLVILVASILLPRVWAYLTAASAFILYGAVLELSFFRVVPSFAITHPAIRTLQSIIFVNLFGFLAIAYLAGLLADKLRQSDTRLAYFRGELESLQALHENIVQSTSDGLITTGLDGRITLVNPAAEKLLQHSEAELLGRSIAPLFADPLPHATSEHAYCEVRFIAPDNFRKTFRVIASELKVLGRGPLGFVYTLDDLTRVRRLEREVRMQDRLAAIGRLSAAIAHEVRNPLTSIAGSASMLSQIPGLNDEHRRLLQIVTRESERLNNIITDFLAYSRTKQYRFAPVDMVPLLEDTLTLLAHRLEAQKVGIHIERRYAAPKAFALADGDRMKQVFWNFCENAVRAMKQGGTLTISIEEIDGDWQFSFADTGPGISPQMVEKVFEPFQSQFEGGTGLGLAIVYQIVQAHEGKVWVRSKPGQGCTFVLRVRKAAEESVAAPTTQPARLSGPVPARQAESSKAEQAHA
jgi:two-component system sensor histidine kinase PilS (NtrC family)